MAIKIFEHGRWSERHKGANGSPTWWGHYTCGRYIIHNSLDDIDLVGWHMSLGSSVVAMPLIPIVQVECYKLRINKVKSVNSL